MATNRHGCGLCCGFSCVTFCCSVFVGHSRWLPSARAQENNLETTEDNPLRFNVWPASLSRLAPIGTRPVSLGLASYSARFAFTSGIAPHSAIFAFISGLAMYCFIDGWRSPSMGGAGGEGGRPVSFRGVSNVGSSKPSLFDGWAKRRACAARASAARSRLEIDLFRDIALAAETTTFWSSSDQSISDPGPQITALPQINARWSANHCTHEDQCSLLRV